MLNTPKNKTTFHALRIYENINHTLLDAIRFPQENPIAYILAAKVKKFFAN